MTNFIPLSKPHFAGNEKKYLKDCINTSWVSTSGKYVDLFEKKIANFTGAKYAVSCINGTSAIHIALILSGVKRNHEVIAPTLSFIAPINAIKYCNAEPVFMDSDDDYCIDIEKTLKFIKNKTKFKNGITINVKTKKQISALIVVHVYGRSVLMDKLITLCKKRNIAIVEDAAEGLGNFYETGKHRGKHCGTVGKFGCLSFNGNKIITTGGGGMILTNNKKLAEKAKYLTTTAKNDPIQFIHDEIGYNYRLTNIQAALGLAQMEKLKNFLNKKRKIYINYLNKLKGNDIVSFREIPQHASSNYWLNLVEFKKIKKMKDLLHIVDNFKKRKIEIRPIWRLNHTQKQFITCQSFMIENALKLVKKTICLPSSVSITNEEMNKITRLLNE